MLFKKMVLLKRIHSTLGDNLLISCVARGLAKRKEPVAVECLRPELFYNNPDVCLIFSPDGRSVRFFRGQIAVQSWRLPKFLEGAGFFNRVCTARFVEPSPLSFYDQLAAAAGLETLEKPRPWYFPSRRELEKAAEIGEGAIVMQSSGRLEYTPNREWLPERFAEVASKWGRRHKIIQVGSPDSVLLPGAVDLRGKTTLRELGALLSSARLFVGQNGGLMHFARAVDLPSVIVYGGYADPALTGYPEFENIGTSVSCAPCYLKGPCPIHRECLTSIHARDVDARIEKILSQPAWPRHWMQ